MIPVLGRALVDQTETSVFTGLLLLLTFPIAGSEIWAQANARFPSARVPAANFAQTSSIQVSAAVTDGNPTNGNGAASAPPRLQESDPNDLLSDLTAHANDGGVDGQSVGEVSALFLPFTSASAWVVEATSAVGGGYGASIFGPGGAVQVVNQQGGYSNGRTQILADPNRPNDTVGLMEMEFKLDSSNLELAMAGFDVSIRPAGATTSGSYLSATYWNGGWNITGQLEQAGHGTIAINEFVPGRDLNKTYTASKFVSVGSQWDTKASSWAAFPPGGQAFNLQPGESTTISLSSLASYWVE